MTNITNLHNAGSTDPLQMTANSRTNWTQ